MSDTKSSTPILTGETLKQALWETLYDLRNNETDYATADSVAGQAREILRTTRTQLAICRQAKVATPANLIRFAASESE